MNNSSIHASLHIFPDNIQGILRCITAVDHKRKLLLPGNLHLGTEHLLLYLMLLFLLMPVIIQTNLSNGDHLVHMGNTANLCQRFLCHLLCIIRMHSHSSVYKRILFNQLHSILQAIYRCTDIYKLLDSMLLHRCKKRLPVHVKSLIIIMGMGIYDHFYNPPYCHFQTDHAVNNEPKLHFTPTVAHPIQLVHIFQQNSKNPPFRNMGNSGMGENVLLVWFFIFHLFCGV